MPNSRIVRALELIHHVKTGLLAEGLAIAPAMLDAAENELLHHAAEIAKAERPRFSDLTEVAK